MSDRRDIPLPGDRAGQLKYVPALFLFGPMTPSTCETGEVGAGGGRCFLTGVCPGELHDNTENHGSSCCQVQRVNLSCWVGGTHYQIPSTEEELVPPGLTNLFL